MKNYYSPSQQSRAQAAQAQALGNQVSRVNATGPRSPNKARNLAPLTQTQPVSAQGSPFISMRSSPRRDSPL